RIQSLNFHITMSRKSTANIIPNGVESSSGGVNGSISQFLLNRFHHHADHGQLRPSTNRKDRCGRRQRGSCAGHFLPIPTFSRAKIRPSYFIAPRRQLSETAGHAKKAPTKIPSSNVRF